MANQIEQNKQANNSNGGAVAVVDILIFVAAALALQWLDQTFVPAGVYQGFLTIIGSFVVVVALMKRRGGAFAEMGLRRPNRLLTLPLWIIAIFVATFAVAGAGQVIALQLIDEPVDLSKFAILHNNLPVLLVSLLSIWITAAFMEEIVYRGFLLRNLLTLTNGGIIAVVLMSLLHAVLFGALHMYQGMVGVIATGLVAVVFGIFYALQGRNLWALIIVHGLIDTLGVLNFYVNGVP